MFTIKTLNAISPVGLAKLNKNLFDVSVDADAPDGNIICLPVYKRYASSQSAIHIIGYLDEQNHGVTGIEKAFDRILFSDETVVVRVPVDAYGRSLGGADIELISPAIIQVKFL